MVSNNLKKSDFFHNKIVVLFFVLVVCFTSGHAMQTINFSLQRLIIPAFLLLSGSVFKEVTGKNLNIHSSSVILLVLMICMTAMIYFGSAAFTYFMLLIFVLTAFGITTVYSFEDFIDTYLKIMTVVAAISIVGYYLVNNTNVLSVLPTYNNVNGVEYKVGWIFNYIVEIPERNCGMFWEPGLFATNLIFSLVFEIAFKKTRPNLIRITLFTWAVITTNSSAGFLLLFFSAWLLFTKGKIGTTKEFNIFSAFIKLIFFVLGLVIILNLDEIINMTSLSDNEYVVKLLSDNVSDSSRARAALFNLEIFLKNPILGAGYSGVFSQMDFVADTSTSTYIMSVFGILGSLYTILWVYGIFKIKHLNVFSKLLICIIVFSIINKEPHLSILLTWTILFYLLKNAVYDKGGNDEIEEL